MSILKKHCACISRERIAPAYGQTSTIQLKLQFITDLVDLLDSWTRSAPWGVKFDSGGGE